MKVSTGIIAGYGVLILLTVAVLAYQVSVIRQLQDINNKLSVVNVGRALTSVDLRTNVDLAYEFARKYYGIGAQQYLDQFQLSGHDLDENLKNLRSPAPSEAERYAIDRFSKTWQAVRISVIAGEKPSANREMPSRLQDQFTELAKDSSLVFNATRTAIEESARVSAKTANDAVRVSWYAAAFALLLSVLVSAPILWSIARRLRELASATRVVAAGKFEHRLPASGNDEFADLARDFNSMARRLGELDQMKKDFVSHVSHDLKGPLASTRETVHLLMEEIPGPLNDKQRRLLGLCLKSSERLSAMIGNLLDVSRMEAGMMDYKMESTDLVPLARNAAAEFEGLLAEKKLEIEFASSAPEILIECDQGRIAQVVGNLIENAIKFSAESSQVGVKIEANGTYAVLAVSDRGPGVPKESRSRIFDRFHQVNPGKKIAGQGVGLGLAICRMIVEAHGGTIWVEDNPDGGSVFFMKLKSSGRPQS